MAQQIGKGVDQLKQKSEGVVTAMGTVSTVVEENTASAEQMASNSQDVTTAMEGIASIAEENSASTEEVSASAEEMSAQIEEVVASAEELSALAEELRTAVAQFQVGNGWIEQEQPMSEPVANIPVSEQQPEAILAPADQMDNGHN
jgi:methyl-accepting chemotaxis protein